MMNLKAWVTLCEARDGDAYFQLTDITETGNHKSRATLAYMTPAEFLAMARPGYDSEKATRVAALMKRRVKFRSTPVLTFEHDGKGTATVVNHEGRHRARILQSIGVHQMPVVLNSVSSRDGPAIRWGSQADPIDHIAVMPTQLRSEDRQTVIAMPKSVIFA